ncbi:hypothetical protein [Bacillus thuringiensis]|uniref:hypothetical protein n=1 Tax=Bacillus thuringiensis TaxID=1428 RepID=UPI00210D6411|nr:hypothetical protein [Bacillus thuringiensis]
MYTKRILKEGIEIEEIQQLVDAETWLSGEEAENTSILKLWKQKKSQLVAVITLINIKKHQIRL